MRVASWPRPPRRRRPSRARAPPSWACGRGGPGPSGGAGRSRRRRPRRGDGRPARPTRRSAATAWRGDGLAAAARVARRAGTLRVAFFFVFFELAMASPPAGGPNARPTAGMYHAPAPALVQRGVCVGPCRGRGLQPLSPTRAAGVPTTGGSPPAARRRGTGWPRRRTVPPAGRRAGAPRRSIGWARSLPAGQSGSRAW